MGRRTWGTVRRLPSGRYQARYTDHSGKQISAPSTFATKADGYRWLAKVQTELDSGRWIDPKAGKETLKVYAEHWVETRLVRGRPLAPRTAELYRAQLKNHIVPALGSTPLRQLEASAVRAWYGKLSGPAGPGQVTAAKCYRLLRAICTTAVDDNLIARNPCSIRGAGQERSTERPMFTLAQVQALVDAVEDRWRALILLAAWTGLRIGELSALRREHLDLQTGTVSVTTAVVDLVGQGRLYGPPKSAAGRRSVAIPPHIIGDLERHLRMYAQAGAHGLVFVGPKGGPIRNNNFASRVWAPAAEAAGLPAGSHLHDLRGWGATIAARHGATTKELMHRLGHASAAAALRYQRAEQERDAALAAAMSTALSQSEGTSST
ncbi:site-specific integrase [Blastococcus saxobsidens]|uniref:Integrase, Lambda phage type n=1 Tax=Blastococcus saxobsidens (strain DD2) TaxID=1146883 RepID=H6RKI5_BLASD|nr:tyrosine-type recombinase/integrase [Blastococcus saxobsidens]CCG02404.1 Integrase, Lambda phage type [Blastococcus saxobsidens DD2]